MKFIKRLQTKLKETGKGTLWVYLILRTLIIIAMIRSILEARYFHAVLCGFSLLLYTVPGILRDKFRIALSGLLEAIVYCFIFAAEILGEIHNFYHIFPYWDTMLHTINGFICAGIGFSLVDLLSSNSKRMHLSPIYVAVVSFCFSMTVGVLWEFFEFTSDRILLTDTQKDTRVRRIASIDLQPDGKNESVIVRDIQKTEITAGNGDVYVLDGYYLDLGLIDTMDDLFVNLIGAVTFSIFGFFYIVHRDKNSIVTGFIPVRIKDDKENEQK